MTEQQRQAVAAMQESSDRAYEIARNLQEQHEEWARIFPRLANAAARAQVYASLMYTAMRMAMEGAECASEEAE